MADEEVRAEDAESPCRCCDGDGQKVFYDRWENRWKRQPCLRCGGTGYEPRPAEVAK